ncbi:TIGR02301 family protein [Bartonella rattaustraliani]|uniref:TIGR02301 family protein n=1 Tax=Bartonella rattaustraliani TaxID=481139 RepID=UPI000371DB72|nr:TIGR02301 family protein [Bartonella rattaustraliani]
MRNLLAIFNILVFFFNSIPTFAQQSSLYDKNCQTKLLRLAEVFGSLHFLQNLCNAPTNKWYDYMNELLEAEQPIEPKRAVFYEAFNRAYLSFAENYHHCTQYAIEANEIYIQESVTLIEDIQDIIRKADNILKKAAP